jgi:hypothetical protein
MYRPFSFGFRNRANPAKRGQQTCKMCARNEYCTYNRRGNHSNCFVPIGGRPSGCMVPVILAISIPTVAAAAVKWMFL